MPEQTSTLIRGKPLHKHIRASIISYVTFAQQMLQGSILCKYYSFAKRPMILYNFNSCVLLHPALCPTSSAVVSYIIRNLLVYKQNFKVYKHQKSYTATWETRRKEEIIEIITSTSSRGEQNSICEQCSCIIARLSHFLQVAEF